MGSGYGFAAVWIVVIGAGLGFALPGAMNAALGALSAERSGVGSALIMALRQVGGTFGVAILGSILSSAYRSGLHAAVVPAGLAAVVRDSVAEGVAVAHQLGFGGAVRDGARRLRARHGRDAGGLRRHRGGRRRARPGVPAEPAPSSRRRQRSRTASVTAGGGAVAASGDKGAESVQPAVSGR